MFLQCVPGDNRFAHHSKAKNKHNQLKGSNLHILTSLCNFVDKKKKKACFLYAEA